MHIGTCYNMRKEIRGKQFGMKLWSAILLSLWTRILCITEKFYYIFLAQRQSPTMSTFSTFLWMSSEAKHFRWKFCPAAHHSKRQCLPTRNSRWDMGQTMMLMTNDAMYYSADISPDKILYYYLRKTEFSVNNIIVEIVLIVNIIMLLMNVKMSW